MKTVKCSRCNGTGTLDKPFNGVSSDRRDAAAGWIDCPVCDGNGEYEVSDKSKSLTTVISDDVKIITQHDGDRYQTWSIHATDATLSRFWGFAETQEHAETRHNQTVGHKSSILAMIRQEG